MTKSVVYSTLSKEPCTLVNLPSLPSKIPTAEWVFNLALFIEKPSQTAMLSFSDLAISYFRNLNNKFVGNYFFVVLKFV